VTDRALAVGLAGLLDGQVHGGAGSRLKRAREQVARYRERRPRCSFVLLPALARPSQRSLSLTPGPPSVDSSVKSDG
jgi:hypothetical protein